MERRALSRKQIAAIVAVVTALAGALGLGVSGQTTAGAVTERVRVLEVRFEGMDKRLERIEDKLDRALEGRK